MPKNQADILNGCQYTNKGTMAVMEAVKPLSRGWRTLAAWITTVALSDGLVLSFRPCRTRSVGSGWTNQMLQPADFCR